MSKEMKLIMETFRSKLNEAPMAPMVPGASPLNLGVATAAGNAEKEAKAKKQEIIKHNDQLLQKLYNIGLKDLPSQHVELEPGDLKGVNFDQSFADELNDVNSDKSRPNRMGGHARFLDHNEGDYVYFKNGKIVSDGADKIDILVLANMLAIVLSKRGLSSSVETFNPDKVGFMSTRYNDMPTKPGLHKMIK